PLISIAFIGAMILKGIATYLNQYLGDLFGSTSVYALRESLYEKLQVLSFKYYDNAKTGNIMTRLTADLEGFRFLLSFSFAELIRITLLILFSLGVIFYYSVPRSLVTMAAMPFLVVVVIRYEKRVHPGFRRNRKSYGRLDTRVQENITGI